MSGSVFVDTNVLVYSRDAAEPKKQQQALGWLSHLWEARRFPLSFQDLQENQEFGILRVINPFHLSPSSLPA